MYLHWDVGLQWTEAETEVPRYTSVLEPMSRNRPRCVEGEVLTFHETGSLVVFAS